MQWLVAHATGNCLTLTGLVLPATWMACVGGGPKFGDLALQPKLGFVSCNRVASRWRKSSLAAGNGMFKHTARTCPSSVIVRLLKRRTVLVLLSSPVCLLLILLLLLLLLLRVTILASCKTTATTTTTIRCNLLSLETPAELARWVTNKNNYYYDRTVTYCPAS